MIQQKKLSITLPVISYVSTLILIILVYLWYFASLIPLILILEGKSQAYVNQAIEKYITFWAPFIVIFSILSLGLFVLKIIVIIQSSNLEKKLVLTLYILGFFLPICTTVAFALHIIEIKEHNKKIDEEQSNNFFLTPNNLQNDNQTNE